jgi:superfamily I DNA and/or RNA helicase
MAYTNRAVDEICQAVSRIEPAVDFIRIGSELSCDERFRPRLIEHVLEPCANRQAVRQRIEACRIYIGTVAALSGKTELFKLKRFDAAIIDEATQILEPQLLGLLCQRCPDGRDAIGKFILIGDHKQLPAVVQQSAEQTEVTDEALRAIGLTNLRDSLFERLHRGLHLAAEADMASRATDMLCRQGRMHPGVAEFPNLAFYFGRLLPLGLPHQQEDIPCPVRFIASQPDATSVTGKTNQQEARLVAECATKVYRRSPADFDPHHTLGIITPYRSQIALIRKALSATGIEALAHVSVDTVERYQGSERDVIIYSFCVNRPFQLRFLPNLTEEEGVLIDRKLNVALTRARKQMVLIGVPEILRQDDIYRRLLDFLAQN